MNEMTTKALIDWSLKQAELCRSDYPRPDLADMHEAIAARLKALEEALRRFTDNSSCQVNFPYECEHAEAILDTVREVEK